jgi:hypothetical protein
VPKLQPNDEASGKARFGHLVAHGWGPLLPAARRHRSRLGLTLAHLVVVEQLLFHYWEPGDWRSWGQGMLADELGIDRTTLKDHLVAIRRQGLMVWRSDPRNGYGKSTNHYCLEPYLAVLALRASADETNAYLVSALRADGRAWLTTLWRRLSRERWNWQLGALSAPSTHDYKDVLEAFIQFYQLGPLLASMPDPIAT